MLPSFHTKIILCCAVVCRWRKQLDELKRRWCGEQAASDRGWANKLQEQQDRWLKVMADLL
jgi:hypothetical protein